MDLQEYKKALMLIQEPVELLTVTEMKERVKLFGQALQFKAWRMETAANRLQRLEGGEAVNVDITPDELDQIWPHPDTPEVSLRDNGFVTVFRCGDNAPVGFVLAFFAALALGLSAVFFG